MNGILRKLAASLESSPLWRHWQQLPSRDRLALSLLGAFLLIVLCYLSIWRPVDRYLDRSRQAFQHQRELFHYIRDNADAGRRQAGKHVERLLPQQLQGVVTSTAKKQGLALERFDSEGPNGLLVTLSQVPFDKLLPWLNELQSRGVVLYEANLDRAAAGLVNARLTLMAEDHSPGN